MQSADDRPEGLLAWPLRLTRGLVVVAFAVMIVVALCQVVFRYLISAPLAWSEEAARYCFVWVVFLGAALGVQRGVHLGVDLFVARLSERWRLGLAVAVNLLIGAFAVAIIHASLPVLRLNAMQHSPALGLPMSWVYLAIPVSMALILVISIRQAVLRIRQRPARPPC